MGETSKAELRERINRCYRAAVEVRQDLARANGEVRRLRSDVATLTHRLDQAYSELRDRRAFVAAVTNLDALVARLELLPTNLPPTGADQQEGTTTT
jgi:septal ring factor EnvC (AmiA/AmiB activator)